MYLSYVLHLSFFPLSLPLLFLYILIVSVLDQNRPGGAENIPFGGSLGRGGRGRGRGRGGGRGGRAIRDDLLNKTVKIKNMYGKSGVVVAGTETEVLVDVSAERKKIRVPRGDVEVIDSAGGVSHCCHVDVLATSLSVPFKTFVLLPSA